VACSEYLKPNQVIQNAASFYILLDFALTVQLVGTLAILIDSDAATKFLPVGDLEMSTGKKITTDA
jgi:hypothetical protein